MSSAQDRRLCTFHLARLRLAVPVADVMEVVRGEQVVEVPLAPDGVVGLLNLRGRIVPVVDARRRLGLPGRPQDDGAAHIVLEVDGEVVSLLVDQEGDVVQVTAEEHQDVPETVDIVIRRLCTAAYQRDDGLVLVLDPRLVAAHDARSS